MTRKFKHKQTDWVAVEEEFNVAYKLYNAHNEYQGRISFRMVESGSDWQEITQEPILVTEDGYELNYGDKYYMVSETFKVQEKRLSKATLFSSAARRFYYQENAEAYIERHKLRYSNADLDSLTERIEIIKDAASDKIEMKAKTKVLIHELKNSKND